MATLGTGYTSIGQYLDANRGTLDDERANLGGLVGREYEGGKAAADKVIGAATPGTAAYTGTPGYGDALGLAQTADADAANLHTPGGVQDLLQRQYGDSTSQAGFDSGLLGGAFDGMKTPSLVDYLDSGLQKVAGQPAPKGPPPPPTGSGGPPQGPPPGGPGPEGGSERDKEKGGGTWPWTYPTDTGTPKKKGPGGK